MRVLLWTELYPPYIGGVEVLARRLAAELTARGHQIVVVTSHDAMDLPDVSRDDGIEVHRLPFRRALTRGQPAGIAESVTLARAIKHAFVPDVVHVAMAGPTAMAYLKSADPARHIPMVLTMQQTMLPEGAGLPGGDSLLARVVAAANWTAACSRDELLEVRRRFPSVAERTSLIPNALVSSPGHCPPLPFEPPRILGIGRLIERKGFDVALEAFARLTGRRLAPLLVVAGDGPARPELEALAARLEVAERVQFTGFVPPEMVHDTYGAATVVVVPSRRAEPFGLVALEAAAMGRPVVASRVGGLPEVVVEGETGLLVPEGDPDALAAAVSCLLDDPERAVRMGRAARTRALGNFSFDRYVDAYEELYRRVTDARVEAGAPRP